MYENVADYDFKLHLSSLSALCDKLIRARLVTAQVVRETSNVCKLQVAINIKSTHYIFTLLCIYIRNLAV